MNKGIKVLLIVVGVLVFACLVFFVGGMTMLQWDFNRLGGGKYETNTYEISQNFEDISIDVATDDISLVLSGDKGCKVVCYEQERLKHAVEANGKTLTISVDDTRKWYEHIGFFSLETPKTTVYLPKEQYASLLIRSSTGDIRIPKDFSFDTIDIAGSTGDVDCKASSKGTTTIKRSTGDILVSDASSGGFSLTASTGEIRLKSVSSEGEIALKVSTGKTSLTDVACKSLSASGSTGDIVLVHVVASGAFSIDRSTGDIMLEECDADTLRIKTSTGKVYGSLLSEKEFITHTSTGSVNVPKNTKGGKCEITTGTGDIDISVKDDK